MAGWIAFALFAGFGVVLLVVGAVQWRQQRWLLQHARPIEVEIVKSEVHRSHSVEANRRPLRSGTYTYRPDVVFRYEVDGRAYESDLLRAHSIATGYASHDAAAEALRPFPVGARVQGFVADAAPQKAFLLNERGNGPLVFVLVGLALIPLAWLGSRLV